MAGMTTEQTNEKKFVETAALAIAAEAPQLIRALVDLKKDRASGTVVVHFSDGGIAQVYARPMRKYK